MRRLPEHHSPRFAFDDAYNAWVPKERVLDASGAILTMKRFKMGIREQGHSARVVVRTLRENLGGEAWVGLFWQEAQAQTPEWYGVRAVVRTGDRQATHEWLTKGGWKSIGEETEADRLSSVLQLSEKVKDPITDTLGGTRHAIDKAVDRGACKGDLWLTHQAVFVTVKKLYGQQ